jgi:hypothetical protein
MRWWDKLKPKPETPEQKAALAKLDEATSQAANEQMDEIEHPHLVGSGVPSLVPGSTLETPGQ